MPNYNFAFSPTTIGSVMSFSLFFIFFITSSRLIYPFSFPLFTDLPSSFVVQLETIGPTKIGPILYCGFAVTVLESY